MIEFNNKIQLLQLEIYTGFIMQLLGDQMENIVSILNKKYNKKIKVANKSWDDYFNWKYKEIPNEMNNTITAHYLEDNCAHWVYYDKKLEIWDAYLFK